MATTQERFDAALAEILDEEPASNLLTVPGVYEILSEHFNNEVLKQMRVNLAADVASRLPRKACEELLARYSIECYEEEPIEILRGAIAVNVEDGTIPPDDVTGML